VTIAKYLQDAKAITVEPVSADATDMSAMPLQNGHQNGLQNGHLSGSPNGHLNGHLNGYSNGYSNAYSNGYSNARSNGHPTSHPNGHSNGLQNGFQNGLQNGTQSAHIEDEDEDVIPPFPKRKRSSLPDAVEEKLAETPPFEEPSSKRPKQSQKIRGVIIGVWRDSDQPNDADKHVIYGFIDIHDRLRTRIYGMNRRGEDLVGNIPLGAGGCWVTFARVIFDPHLASLNTLEVKEYVRIRSGARPEATEEERRDADEKAVLRAQTIVRDAGHENGTPAKKPVVQRAASRASQGRQSLTRQTLNHTPSFKAVNAVSTPTPKSSPVSDVKPTGVLLGYWADSSESRPEDKHAVYGVVGGTDCFRVKVQRVTRDGRYVDGNFPVGAGALWLHYDRVVFDPALRGMSRPEIKEYVRIRQRDLESKETEKERKANEAKAIREAKELVASEGLDTGVEQTKPSPEVEVRHSSRTFAAKQQAEADAAAAALRARKEKADVRDRQAEKTRKEVAMAEAVVQEAAQQELKNNIKKLNKVWVAQQAATTPGTGPSTPPVEEAKYHNGIKYERKQNGPFQGGLVSSAQILTIDGEDFIEYRVLTKPSFF
jgi:hypothetical protein